MWRAFACDLVSYRPSITALVTSCDDPIKAVAGELNSADFSPLQDCVAAVLSEIGDAVRTVLDCEHLRSIQSLSALAGGEEGLGLPALAPLNNSNPHVLLHQVCMSIS